MSRILREILEEVAGLTPDVVEKHAPKEGGATHNDKAVGQVPDELKPLWAYLGVIVSKIEVAETAAHEELDAIDSRAAQEAKRLQLVQGLMLMRKKAEIAKETFWAELRQSLWDEIGEAENIGIREGWRVVTSESEGCDCPICRAVGGKAIAIPVGSGDLATLLGGAVVTGAIEAALRRKSAASAEAPATETPPQSEAAPTAEG